MIPTAANYIPLTEAEESKSRGLSHVLQTRVSVCHLTSGDAWGGAEAQVATLVRQLSKRSEIDLSAIVLNRGRLADEMKSCGIETQIIDQRQKSFPQILVEAHRFVRQRNVSILHSHRYKENLLASLLRLRHPEMALVRTQHGRPETLTGMEGIKQWLVHSVDRVTGRYSADRVISVSRQLTSYLERHIGSNKIAIIPNGVACSELVDDEARADAKAKLGIPVRELVVGFVGRLEKVKRPDLFIDVARHLGTRVSNLTFVLAGNGREQSSVRRLAATSGLGNRMLLLGHCNDATELLRAMDLLLIPSDHEGLPMVLLEAMALGTPVVSRAVGGVPEVITHDESGCLVDSHDPAILADACMRLLRDKALRDRIARAARNVIQTRFSAARNAEMVVNLYRSLIEVEPIAHSAVASQLRG